MSAADDSPAPARYSLAQVLLHWTIAALIVFQLLYNDAVQSAFEDRLNGTAVPEAGGAWIHVAVGLTVLVLAVLRLGIRVQRGVPEVHEDKPAILNWIGVLTHYLLYAFIFIMPISGALAWFLGIEMSAEIHEIGRFVLLPAIGLHVLGALAEHFVFRNNSLLRMLRMDDK